MRLPFGVFPLCLLIAMTWATDCIGEVAYAGQEPLLVGDSIIQEMVADSDYVFWGVVVDSELKCRIGGPRWSAEVRVVAALMGRPHAGHISLLVYGAPSTEDCPGPMENVGPASFDPGEEYLFFVVRPYSNKEDNYRDLNVVPNGGVLCARGTRRDVYFCGKARRFSTPDPYGEVLNAISAVSPESLSQGADLILRVGDVRIKTPDPPVSENILIPGNTATATVLEVLKGEYTKQNIEFVPDSSDSLNSGPSFPDGCAAIVLLRTTGERYELVGNNRGCFVASGMGLLSSRGAGTSVAVHGSQLVSEDR